MIPIPTMGRIANNSGDTQKTLKLGTVILAAADLEIDVVNERDATERVGRASERTAVYFFEHDRALRVAHRLAGGIMRMGDFNPDHCCKQEFEALRGSRRLQLIDARIHKPGNRGHNHFPANPAVGSDRILLRRYQLPPGGEFDRAPEASDAGFRIIGDEYPGSLDAPRFKALQFRARAQGT